MSSRLYRYYMQQTWLFHANGTSVHLISKIGSESNRLTNQVITPFLQLNARVVMALVMTTAIFIYNPFVAIAGLLIFTTAYFVLYRTVRRRLQNNGSVITEVNRDRLKLMQEGFGGIKDTMLLGRQSNFNLRFAETSSRYGRALGANMVLAQVPRYAMELLAFSSIIVLVMYLLSVHEGDLATVLPVLAVYALAGFKLLPAFQQIYVALASLRGNMIVFDNLKADLESSKFSETNTEIITNKDVDFQSEITMDNIWFRYPNKKDSVLKGLNVSFPKNKVIGLVGASGSGKSTAIDIILGLIEPDIGCLCVDGEQIDSENKRGWQNKIGYVPQSIFLADSSIRENIAFGLSPEKIDEDKVRNAVRIAHLEDLIKELPEGLDSRVGERGLQLSGGQRQRIGIARALYDGVEVLVMDEATSALDGITEKSLMDAIHDLSGKKTIIMIAHRLATVKKCDNIYLMGEGRVIDSGTYDELVCRNDMFRRMADHI
ncbi:ABC transporter ATP-binding protein [Marinobacterium zhoushanense]|uniref:ABC transporter ATP-binding protein n=1 Tax=Marinobacterium zhoushanense TaxID=1679163 RepID=A0ABQ1KTR1_9GAMM|nr:ABC transporter ATP-binding protein [Marinobacterium zhoushanense]